MGGSHSCVMENKSTPGFLLPSLSPPHPAWFLFHMGIVLLWRGSGGCMASDDWRRRAEEEILLLWNPYQKYYWSLSRGQAVDIIIETTCFRSAEN